MAVAAALTSSQILRYDFGGSLLVVYFDPHDPPSCGGSLFEPPKFKMAAAGI